MQNKQNVDAMMETDEPIQDVNANLSKKRNTRGPTKMKRLPSNFANRIVVEFNEHAEPIGEGSVHLSSYLRLLIREHVPVTLTNWRRLGDYLKAILWECVQTQSGLFKAIRRKQMPHTCSCKGMAQLAADMEKIKKYESESQSSMTTNVREDALSAVLGQDRPGRLKGMRGGITYTKFVLSQANQKQTMQLQNRVADLEKTVHMLLSQNQGHGSCKDESPSQVNKHDKINDKCNLLDWTRMDEIVAEGRVLSTDPKELLCNIPFGPNTMKILTEFPKKLDAFLWRPIPRMISHIGEAKDEIIAWPADRVVLHTMVDFEKDDVMSKTSSTYNKCKLYNWFGSKELVAEERLYSSDPNQLVNNIPLGQSVVLVSIDKPKKSNAFLWRRPTGMAYVREAVGSKIAWPQKNVVLENINATSTHMENTILPPMSTIFKSNIKCKLIGVHGAKEVIAEGRVSSTDSNALVHFVPLGENVVKVWVDIIKVSNVSLWRPTSEFEFIEDAIGSTIAWPSANVIIESTSSN